MPHGALVGLSTTHAVAQVVGVLASVGGIGTARLRSSPRRRWTVLRLVLSVMLGALSLLPLSTPALAATRTVVNGDNDGSGSLRDTIAAAQPGDKIVFEEHVSTISLTTGEIVLNKNLTIEGPGSVDLTIRRATGNARIFSVTNNANVAISGVTMTDGDTNDVGGGGAIRVFAGTVVSIVECVIANNTAGFAGAINNEGTLSITKSTVRNNTSDAYGGGIFNSGVLTIGTSTLSGNNGTILGGAIASFGTIHISDSTINGNSAAQGGGLELERASTSTIVNSTVSGNSGHGIFSQPSLPIVGETRATS